MRTCCENKSLLVAYHHAHINKPCVWLALQIVLFLFWKSIPIGLYVLKLEVMILEVFPKHILWPNILFIFPLISWNLHDQQLSLISQTEMIFLIIFCCNNYWVRNVNLSFIKVATYHIYVIHGCFKYWYILQFICDGFYWARPWSL